MPVRRSTLARPATVALTALCSVLALLASGITARAGADPGLLVLGLMVSPDQHAGGAAIQWDRVAATGARVATIEATDGARYRNPWLGADFYNAGVAGLVRGTYAVGRPAAPVVTTATQQADYYLTRIAGYATAGRSLPPMLDLQTTGGLTTAQLITWTQTFLLRVQSKTGRAPILHTFGFYWSSALASTDALTRYPLWTSAGVSGFPGVPTAVQTLAVNADDATWAAWQSGRESNPWADAVPGAPEQIRARAYDGTASVSWLPGDSGSTPVTSYQVLAEPGDVATTVRGDMTTAIVTGLSNGTTYNFSVVAANSVGGGAPSQLSAPVTPLAGLGAAPPVSVNPPQRSLYTSSCMAPSNLVRHTKWTWMKPAPGVTLAEGHHRDAAGRVQMHVLRVDLKNSHIRLAPLMRHVSDRHKLSVLARQSKLVAATNAGYFDLGSHAPIGPVVVGGQTVFGPSVTSTVAGIGPDGLMTTAGIAAAGSVTAPGNVLPLVGWNAAQPAEGVNAYSARWGARAVPMPRDAVSRLVTAGAVSSPIGRSATAPAHGYLLVARGSVAAGWLRSLQVGDPVAVRIGLTSSSKPSLSLGFSVGGRIVTNGVAGTGLVCKRTERLPARTAIGWTADRRTLLLVVVDNYRRAKLHGLEPAQLARVMRDLGAAQAYMLDGGGSTEMVVRPRPGAKLSIRNHPSDGRERLIPLGIGIFRR